MNVIAVGAVVVVVPLSFDCGSIVIAIDDTVFVAIVVFGIATRIAT